MGEYAGSVNVADNVNFYNSGVNFSDSAEIGTWRGGYLCGREAGGYWRMRVAEKDRVGKNLQLK